MGIVPLQFQPEESADSLGLTGKEQFTIGLNGGSLVPGQIVDVKIAGTDRTIKVKLRFDTEVEIAYFRNGGILQYVLRRLVKK
jgi:aconitate hydratase